MKNITSSPFRTTRTQNNHQVALLGKSKMKHRRGWSSKKRNSSYRELPRRTSFDRTQMMKRSMIGNPVLPMTMRKLPRRRGKIAYWKDTMESGVSVKPRSLNMDVEVNTPLQGFVLRVNPPRRNTFDSPPRFVDAITIQYRVICASGHDPRNQTHNSKDMETKIVNFGAY